MSNDEKADDRHGVRELWTHDEDTRWENLFALLTADHIEPSATQWDADDASLGPLECSPAGSMHDPMMKDTWTIAMVLAWIITREADAVREYDNDYRKQCLSLEPYLIPGENEHDCEIGWIQNQPKPVTAIALAIDMEMQDRHAEYRDAKSDLWSKLVEGALVGIAAHVSSSDVVNIPALTWGHLDLYADARNEDCLTFRHEPLNIEYRQVLFRRSDILALWPSVIDAAWKPVEALKLLEVQSPAVSSSEADAPNGASIGFKKRPRKRGRKPAKRSRARACNY